MNKARPLIIRMTDAEVIGLEEFSTALFGRKNKSRIVRKLVREFLGYGPDLLESELNDFRLAVRQLTGMARNLNQITKAVNSDDKNLSKVDEKYLDKVSSEVASLNDKLKSYILKTKNRTCEVSDE